MFRAMLRTLAVTACAVAGVSAQGTNDLQIGLRLNSEYSMQWSGGKVFLEGRSHDVIQTSAKTIYDIWPGSVVGSFSVSFDQGVGLLLGDRIVPAGPLFGEGTMLRSGRVETICGAIVSKQPGGSSDTQFVEWRTPTVKRALVTVPGTILDFDVDASSRIVYLTSARRLYLLADGKVPGAELTLPKEFSARPARVFVDAAFTEFVVYGDTQIAIFTIPDRKWTVRPFDTKNQALVRHAVTRRIRPEDRFR